MGRNYLRRVPQRGGRFLANYVVYLDGTLNPWQSNTFHSLPSSVLRASSCASSPSGSIAGHTLNMYYNAPRSRSVSPCSRSTSACASASAGLCAAQTSPGASYEQAHDLSASTFCCSASMCRACRSTSALRCVFSRLSRVISSQSISYSSSVHGQPGNSKVCQQPVEPTVGS